MFKRSKRYYSRQEYNRMLTFVKRKYITINGRPVEDIPVSQLSAIYHSMIERRKRDPEPLEHQITIEEIIKENENGKG